MANNIDYFEIGSPDPAASRAFYGRLFDWEIEETPQGDQPYMMVDQANGGLWDTSAVGGGKWAIFYVHVEDVAASAQAGRGPRRQCRGPAGGQRPDLLRTPA